MRGGCFGKRQDSINNGPNLSSFNKLHRFQQLCLRAHERTKDRQVPVKHLPEIRAGIVAACCSAGNKPSIVFQ